MRVSRFFADQALEAHSEVVVKGQRAHYIRNVLRLKANDRCVLFNGKGGCFEGVILEVGRGEVSIALHDHQPQNKVSELPITLGLAILKRDAMDTAIQKAVELGAHRIVPLVTERVSINDAALEKKQLHWQSIAISACEQCGRNLLPIIAETTSYEHFVSQHQELICTLMADTTTMPDTTRTEVHLLVGPEGGFSSYEEQAAAEAGWHALALGPRVLRAETAAIAALTLAQSTWGDMAV